MKHLSRKTEVLLMKSHNGGFIHEKAALGFPDSPYQSKLPPAPNFPIFTTEHTWKETPHPGRLPLANP